MKYKTGSVEKIQFPVGFSYTALMDQPNSRWGPCTQHSRENGECWCTKCKEAVITVKNIVHVNEED